MTLVKSMFSPIYIQKEYCSLTGNTGMIYTYVRRGVKCVIIKMQNIGGLAKLNHNLEL
jgi:hypothetical protein